MAIRDDILNAVYEANRLHKEFDTEARAKSGEGRIDVFGMLVEKDIPVMFRPLRNLLGAYIKDPSQGVMVTTQRQLPVQRFTAAHELGHAALGHDASLDEEEILTRALFDRGAAFDSREIQANAFATALLTPQWLIVEHMKRQGWNRDNLTDPVIVYQLSLRMGTSYQATCYALLDCKGIDRRACDKLLESGRKKSAMKQALAKPYIPHNWYGDVWIVTERDNGMVLEGSHSDLVVIKVQEHASSGYVWQFGELAKAGLAIRNDGHASQEGEHIGGIVFRTVIAEADGYGSSHVSLREVRPWQTNGTPLHSMELDVNLSGPVEAGLLYIQRQELLEAA
ncbi:MAG: ImmA/IrrE family metallo-endopeptidase [Pirellulales bacterium]